MGNAKARGTYAERKQQAIERGPRAKLPETWKALLIGGRGAGKYKSRDGRMYQDIDGTGVLRRVRP